VDRLAALEAFAAVAERGGFAAAARALRVSPSTVTRLVAGLEERVGIRLLTRTTRSVRLTDGGTRFLEYTRRILADVTEAEESARRERARPTGRLVVTAPVLFGRMHVGGVLCAYLTRYPEVTGELRLTDRIVNLVDEGVDVAVRIGELAASGLIARRVGASRRVLVGAPRYLDGAPPLRAPRDLQRHTLISFTPLAPGSEWSFQRDDREVRVAVQPRLVTNSGDAALDLARRGGGLTLALAYQVADAIRAGTLRLLLPAWEPPASPIHLVHPTSRLLSPRVRLFIEQVVKTARWTFLS